MPVQDQEHAWTVKLLTPESARMMVCSISSSSWKSEDGVKRLGWDGAVPYGSRAYLADWLAHWLNALRDIILILINYLSENKFINLHSIKSHSSLHKSIIKQTKKIRITPNLWLLMLGCFIEHLKVCCSSGAGHSLTLSRYREGSNQSLNPMLSVTSRIFYTSGCLSKLWTQNLL